MKQKDIAIIIVIAAVSGVISFFLSGKLFVGSNNEMQAEVVDTISADFTPPSDKYFNKDSINPAQTIQLGAGGNSNPFTSQ